MDKFQKSLKSVSEKLKLKLKRKKDTISVGKETCFPVYVGEKEENRKRYEIPVRIASSEIFLGLLVEFENYLDEGPITLPCSVQRFDRLLTLMDRATLAKT
ncbi:hypothetical protein M5689_021531 [Euphorbia peplus]|nr:hypothetical protein M5689_021531 [Euphorbia peplus]